MPTAAAVFSQLTGHRPRASQIDSPDSQVAAGARAAGHTAAVVVRRALRAGPERPRTTRARFPCHQRAARARRPHRDSTSMRHLPGPSRPGRRRHLMCRAHRGQATKLSALSWCGLPMRSHPARLTRGLVGSLGGGGGFIARFPCREPERGGAGRGQANDQPRTNSRRLACLHVAADGGGPARHRSIRKWFAYPGGSLSDRR